VLFCLAVTVSSININGEDIETKDCPGPVYSGHDMGYVILIASGAGMQFGWVLLLIIYFVLTSTKTEREVMGIKLYSLRIPCLVLVVILFVLGTPLLVTGAYYGSWSKKYDITGGCDNLVRVSATIPVPLPATITPINMTVGYVGDSGASEHTLSVYQLMIDEGAELIVHVGDFDYCDDSTLFGTQLNATLGNVPFLAVVGNHDLHVWGDYSNILETRYNAVLNSDYLQCDGILFVNYWCLYRGLFIAFSSVGTKCGDGYSSYGWHETELKNQLEISHNFSTTGYVEPWVTCAWHKNQEKLQLGSKSDETGYGVYNLCSDEGAFIVTGHSHTYGRSYGLGNIEQLEIKDQCQTKVDGVCIYDLSVNEAIVSLVGLGGKEENHPFVDDNANLPHWASKYNAVSGALICVYNYNGLANVAYCYFKDINGAIIDEFFYTQRGAVIP